MNNYRYDFDDRKKGTGKKLIFVIIFIILVIIVASILFRNNSNPIVNKVATTVSYPFCKIKNVFDNSFSNVISYFSHNKSVNEENEALRNKINELELKLLESKRISDENESLKVMLDIKKSFQHFDIKVAKIIYREHDNWTQTFKINIGSNDGVELNKCVVHTNGLVGYISSVDENTSTVTTILDPSSSVSITISTINEPALLKGDFELKDSNKLKLTFIPLETEISIADQLYTSGLGSMYPSSIPVGKIIEISSDKSDINRYSVVEPNVNIRTISEVGVILN